MYAPTNLLIFVVFRTLFAVFWILYSTKTPSTIILIWIFIQTPNQPRSSTIIFNPDIVEHTPHLRHSRRLGDRSGRAGGGRAALEAPVSRCEGPYQITRNWKMVVATDYTTIQSHLSTCIVRLHWSNQRLATGRRQTGRQTKETTRQRQGDISLCCIYIHNLSACLQVNKYVDR